VERLSELPEDADAASALQRIALQNGVPQRALAAPTDSGVWRLVHDEAEAHAAEAEWIAQATTRHSTATPTDLLVRRAVKAYGPALLHAGSGGNPVALAGLTLIVLALVCGWFALAAPAFLLLALAWAVRRCASVLIETERRALGLAPPALPREGGFGGVLDAAIGAIGAWAQPAVSGQGLIVRAFPAVMLVALVRIVPRAVDTRWGRWIEDRSLLSLLLTTSAIAGVAGVTIAALAAALALFGVIWPERPARLTRA
jgi:hypothetical protein